MNEAPCAHPDQERLRAFAWGQLSALEAEPIEAHLGECAACGALVEAFPDNDLIALLRGLSATASVPEPAEGFLDRTLGDFRLIRLVARGGMGIVFEAEQISLC